MIFLNKGWRIIARYLGNSYVGDLVKETIGLTKNFFFVHFRQTMKISGGYASLGRILRTGIQRGMVQ